ncbi:MAG: M15 family metallopeptidase [Bacteroidota bacterium]
MDIQQISLDRIEKLHPAIRNKVKEAYLHINKNILGKGIKMGITQGLRTFEEQNKLYNQKPKVTNSKGGQSFHNYGLAFDFAIFYDTNSDGVFEQLSWDMNKDYDKDGNKDWHEVINYLKSISFTWGGDFKSIKDHPHFEMTFGNSWQKLLEKYNKKDFIAGTNYVNI